MSDRISKIRPPCLTVEQCAEALKMETLGYNSAVIAKSFNVNREHLIITMQYAKEYGFIYFKYQGPLIDHVETLRALGAKRYSYGIREKFCALTGLNVRPSAFTTAIVKLRPHL